MRFFKKGTHDQTKGHTVANCGVNIVWYDEGSRLAHSEGVPVTRRKTSHQLFKRKHQKKFFKVKW